MASGVIFLLGLLLCGLSSLVAGDKNTSQIAVSTFYNQELAITFSLHVDQDSDDVDFLLQSPPYSWVGVGIGSGMAGALMLVFYSSADGESVTVSPRLATGQSEPAYYPSVVVTQDSTSGIFNGDFRALGTCKGCRQWETGSLLRNTTAQPFILGWGSPADTLASDDLAVRIKRHTGYAHFTMNTIQATGTGGISAMASLPSTNSSSGAALVGDLQEDKDSQGLAHGIVMGVATLVVAPVDIITAGALSRWPVLHIITSTGLMAFVVAGMAVGIHVSRLYLVTQKYQTPHQILGLVAIVAMFLVAALGVYGRLMVKSALRRGDQPPAWSTLLRKVHRWIGRIIWAIMLVNVGLGLQFAEANRMLIIGYIVIAAGALVLVALIRWTIHCCTKHKNEDEEEDKNAFELAQIYGPNH